MNWEYDERTEPPPIGWSQIRTLLCEVRRIGALSHPTSLFPQKNSTKYMVVILTRLNIPQEKGFLNCSDVKTILD